MRLAVDTIVGDGHHAPRHPPCPAGRCVVARETGAGAPGVASSAARAAADAASAGATAPARPVAMGVALQGMDGLATGAGPGGAGDRGRVAPAGVRLFWTWKSRHRTGRPPVPGAVRDLIRTISRAHPLWGAPRIHGELLKVGLDVSQTSVAKYMTRHRRPPSQTWKTFLANHIGQIMAADVVVVPAPSWPFRCWVVCITATNAARRSGVPHRRARMPA